MQVPLSWLKDYVDVPVPAAELAERLTLAGMEVGAIDRIGDQWDPKTVVVGQVRAVELHPNADRLLVVTVDHGAAEPTRVVTGAPNLRPMLAELPEGFTVAFAREGAELVDAYSEQRPRPKKVLRPAKIRGVESRGMICSERELGLSEEHEGVMLLPGGLPVGAPLRDCLGDEVLHLELTPDMARCLSIVGVAREVSALLGLPLRLPELPGARLETQGPYEEVSVEIVDPDLCHRYLGLVVREVTIGPSPGWMQQRLQRAGCRPINNVVDITNYVMLELGQPLHAFDYDLLLERAVKSGRARPRIIVRRGAPGESMTSLDGARRALDDSTLLIADTAGPIALAGIMGGLETEIHDGTRNLLLESATFDRANNRLTAQRLKLISDASRRFTWGVPATLNPLAAVRAASLIEEHAGGRIVPGSVDAYPVPQPQAVVYTTASEVRRSLGVGLSLPEIARVLQNLGMSSERIEAAELPPDPCEGTLALHVEPGEPALKVQVPWHRMDVAIPADLTEEVGRIHGFGAIPPTLLADALPEQYTDPTLKTEEFLRDLLLGAGLHETINYTLTSREHHLRMRVVTEAEAIHYVTLANPLSPERVVMRRSMLISAVENLVYNQRFTDRLATFEIGRVYLVDGPDQLLPREERRISLLLTGPRTPASLQAGEAPAPFDFFDLKGVVELILDRSGYRPGEVVFVPGADHPSFGPNQAEVRINGKSLGVLGELHPEIQAAFGIRAGRVFLAELGIDPLLERALAPRQFRSISHAPAVIEDLAFVVKETVPASEVTEAIRRSGGTLLTGIALFDVYQGEHLAAGTKSLAFRVSYQSPDATLSNDQIAAIRGQIVDGVARLVGGTLRS
jgi:phenylalanyl-tRNA synthetase beta chain